MARTARAALWFVCVSACAAGMAGGARAQAPAPAQRLQEAVRQLESVGDYDAALRLLKDLTSSSDRSVAARAWLYIGLARERLGQAAADAYQRVVRDFSDQPDTVARARVRLLALQPAPRAPERTPTTRQMKWSTFYPYGPPSRDGRVLPGSDGTNGFSLLQLQSGQAKSFDPPDATPDDLAHYSCVSPDGSTIAITYYHQTDQGLLTQLRLLQPATGTWRTVLSSHDIGFLHPTRWTPDGRAILTAVGDDQPAARIVLVAVDGSVRPLVDGLETVPEFLDLSPDGRSVVYDTPQRAGADERDIWRVDVATGQRHPLVQHAANDTQPVFTPDGAGVLFSSDRTGSPGLWLQPLTGVAAEGEPVRLAQNVGPFNPLGFTAAGTLYYQTLTGLVDVYVADVDLPHASVSSPRKIQVGRVVGSNLFSSWSPDSRQIAFTSRRIEMSQSRRQTVVVHDVGSGATRELATPLIAMAWSDWAPDGTRLLLRGTGRIGEDPRPRQTLWTVDLSSGDARVVIPPGEPGVTAPRWRRDGRAVYFLRGRKLFERDLATGQERMVNDPGGYGMEVSPNGDDVAFVRRADAGPQVSVARIGQPAQRTIAEFPPTHYLTLAGWTPDGTEVVVAATDVSATDDRSADEMIAMPWLTEIWAVRAGDGTKRKLGAVTLVNARTFRLSPDGRRLSFEAGIFARTAWSIEGFLPATPRQARKAAAARR